LIGEINLLHVVNNVSLKIENIYLRINNSKGFDAVGVTLEKLSIEPAQTQPPIQDTEARAYWDSIWPLKSEIV